MYKAVKPALCEGNGTGIMKSTVLVLGPVQALGSVQVSVPEQVLGRILVLVPEQVLGMVLGGN